MKVELLQKVGPHEAGTILEVNDNMSIHLIGHKYAQKAIETPPENKAIFTKPKNKNKTVIPHVPKEQRATIIHN